LARSVRTTLEYVRDIHRFPAEPHRSNDFRKKLTGFPNERFCLDVFIHAGSFADEHQAGIDVTHAKDNVFTGRSQVLTFHAGQGAATQIGECGEFGVGIQGR
jgi:hypothetical protein